MSDPEILPPIRGSKPPSRPESTGQKCWVPHPFRVFCEKGGKPRTPIGPIHQDEISQGPSLKLLFGLVALALAAAIGLALLIVAPFYRRR
jgi:hypothetical protein